MQAAKQSMYQSHLAGLYAYGFSRNYYTSGSCKERGALSLIPWCCSLWKQLTQRIKQVHWEGSSCWLEEANDHANIRKECQAAEVEVGSNGMEMSRAYCSQGAGPFRKILQPISECSADRKNTDGNKITICELHFFQHSHFSQGQSKRE